MYWKGFFPKGHVLNAMSSAIFTGFRKKFSPRTASIGGLTSDTDNRIHARNSLEEIEIKHGSKGTLEPGRYILLKYLDPPWQGFYDIFKIINEDLMIGRVYLGEFPERRARLHLPDVARLQLRPDDRGRPPGALRRGYRLPPPPISKACGAWTPSPTPTTRAASPTCQFNNQPDGRLEARYELMGLMEGLVAPSFLKDHFQLNDFTPFHDEIRKVSAISWWAPT